MSHVDQMTVENLVEWEFEPRVLRVLEDAIRQAKRRNQSTFVRVNWPSESFDLLDAVNHGCTLRKRTFAWSDADDRRSFVALDALEERETSGAVRFAQVGLWSSELRERVLEVALVEGGPQAKPSFDGRWLRIRCARPGRLENLERLARWTSLDAALDCGRAGWISKRRCCCRSTPRDDAW